MSSIADQLARIFQPAADAAQAVEQPVDARAAEAPAAPVYPEGTLVIEASCRWYDCEICGSFDAASLTIVRDGKDLAHAHQDDHFGDDTPEDADFHSNPIGILAHLLAPLDATVTSGRKFLLVERGGVRRAGYRVQRSFPLLGGHEVSGLERTVLLLVDILRKLGENVAFSIDRYQPERAAYDDLDDLDDDYLADLYEELSDEDDASADGEDPTEALALPGTLENQQRRRHPRAAA